MHKITCPRCGFHCPSIDASRYFHRDGKHWQTWCKACCRRRRICRAIAAQQIDTSNLWHAVIQQACRDAVGDDKRESLRAWRWLFRPNPDFEYVLALSGVDACFFSDKIEKTRGKRVA